jgi:hypothetical protein
MSAALIIESSTTLPEKCRCGIRIDPGGKVLRVDSVSSAFEVLFRGQVFCSPRCLRQFCLESMETLDALDTPGTAMTVIDVHELYAGVAELFAATLSSPA